VANRWNFWFDAETQRGNYDLPFWGMEVLRNVHRILVRGVNAPLPPEVKKI